MYILECIAPSLTCLTAVQGVASSIPAQSHPFVEIDYEIISSVLLIQEELLSVTSESLWTKYWFKAAYSSLPWKKVWLGELTVPI